MSAYSAGPAVPVGERLTDRGREMENRYGALFRQLAEAFGEAIATGDQYALAWLLQASFAVSKLAVDMADKSAKT